MAEQIENSVENSPANPLAEPGSIAATVARLTRWGRLAPQGLARVEFISEFSRQRVMNGLREELNSFDVALHEIELPVRTPAVEIVDELKAKFQTVQDGVVSLSGFEAAFPSDVPLADSLRILNFNRENLADHPLRQIWWMTPTFAQEFVQTVPDLDSWFIIKLILRDVEVLPVNTLPNQIAKETPEYHEALADAYARLAYLRERFFNAAETGLSGSDLLHIILPAYINLCYFEPSHVVQPLLNETFQFLESRGFDVEAFIQDDKVGEIAERALLYELAVIYSHNGLMSEAERLLRRGMELQTQPHQWYSSEYTPQGFTKALAGLYSSQGRFDEAEILLDRLLNTEEQKEDEREERTLRRAELASLYAANNSYNKAENLFTTALEQSLHDVSDGRVESVELIACDYADFLRHLGRNLQANLLETEYGVSNIKHSILPRS